MAIKNHGAAFNHIILLMVPIFYFKISSTAAIECVPLSYESSVAIDCTLQQASIFALPLCKQSQIAIMTGGRVALSPHQEINFAVLLLKYRSDNGVVEEFGLPKGNQSAKSPNILSLEPSLMTKTQSLSMEKPSDSLRMDILDSSRFFEKHSETSLYEKNASEKQLIKSNDATTDATSIFSKYSLMVPNPSSSMKSPFDFFPPTILDISEPLFSEKQSEISTLEKNTESFPQLETTNFLLSTENKLIKLPDIVANTLEPSLLMQHSFSFMETPSEIFPTDILDKIGPLKISKEQSESSPREKNIPESSPRLNTNVYHTVIKTSTMATSSGAIETARISLKPNHLSEKSRHPIIPLKSSQESSNLDLIINNGIEEGQYRWNPKLVDMDKSKNDEKIYLVVGKAKSLNRIKRLSASPDCFISFYPTGNGDDDDSTSRSESPPEAIHCSSANLSAILQLYPMQQFIYI